MADHTMDHFIDLLWLSDVDLDRQGVEAGVAQVGRALLQVFGLPAANSDIGAEFSHPFRNRETEPGAASRHDRDFALEQRRSEHRVRLPARERACPRVY